MQKGIYISIKKEHLQRIVALEKNYEFRNYYPKNGADVLYVYESSPTCELKYIIELGEIIKHPDKITKEGYGNLEFNQGLKTKYAYEIKHLYALEKPISLKRTLPENRAGYTNGIALIFVVLNLGMFLACLLLLAS